MNDPSKKNEQIILDLLKIDSNKYCADCGQKGTRWASWNIGVFLCIRCGGLHRSLGTHISKVKSVTLDKWTDDQVESIKSKGNAKVNMKFNPNPDKHPFPTFSGDMENFIRDKYERNLFANHEDKVSGPMSLKNSAHGIDLLSSGSSSKDGFFKMNSPEILSVSTSHPFAKQLDLLSEMGFKDSELNLKILKASNGNMQDALEIIVASNQKNRRKLSEKNIFDEFETVVRSPKSMDSSFQTEKDSISLRNQINISTEPVKSPPPMSMDDWSSASTSVNVRTTEINPNIESVSSIQETRKPSISSRNPWDDVNNDDAEKTEKEIKKQPDPFDSYSAFKPNPEIFYDNPW